MNNLLVLVLISNGKIWNNRSPERFISGETESVQTSFAIMVIIWNDQKAQEAGPEAR